MKNKIPIYLVRNREEKEQYKFKIDIGDTVVDIREIIVQKEVISKDVFLNFINNSKPKPSELYLFLENIDNHELATLKTTLKKPIKEFEMSVRLLNGLKASNIETIEDILANVDSKQGLFGIIKDIGKKSANELEELLGSKKLNFKMDPEVILNYKK